MSRFLGSDMWNYFNKTVNQKAQCKICKATISYKSTVSNLKKHIKNKHIGI